MIFKDELETNLRAHCSLIVIKSNEEERVIEVIKQFAVSTGRQAVVWDMADAFQGLTPLAPTIQVPLEPIAALAKIEKLEGEILVVLKDFHLNWDDPLLKRKVRNIAQKFKGWKKWLIVLAPFGKIPEELRDESVIIDFPLPTRAEIEDVLNKICFTAGVKVKLTTNGREKLIQAALGLTVTQAQRVFTKAYIMDGALEDSDLSLVSEEKKRVIQESEALEYYGATETSTDVGGLKALKDWLHLREGAFTKEARDYGLPAPKGVALIGIPGTGKSLTAKTIGSLWKMPLIRLDVGSLFGAYVGESEERARRAFQMAETVAPCILWIDEIEKAFAGQGGNGDSGTGSRVFGTIITWMQEKKSPCFVVATANEVGSLPPEFLRRGRFDEVFFLDLPTQKEREEILTVHISKRNRDPKNYAIDILAKASSGYVGAEIEQAIVDAMYIGFDQKREFTTQDILAAFKNQIPLSVSQKEQVEHLRRWVKDGRAKLASYADPVDDGANESMQQQYQV